MNPRQSRILDLLREDGEVTVTGLAKQFEVTPMTVRRDLATLERDGRLTRTHGGAVLSRTGVIEFAFSTRSKTHAQRKRAVARTVADQIKPGMTVTLDTGTTTLEVARALMGVSPLTVLTSSLAIASVLYACDNINLVLLGGVVRRGSPDLSGALTLENLKQFRVQVAVLGTDGVDGQGAYTDDVNVARVSQGIIQGAEKTILACDSSKLGRTGFVKFADWKDFSVMITDSGAPAPVRRWLNRTGPEVLYAPLET